MGSSGGTMLKLSPKIRDWISRYKYALLVALCGVALMLIPTEKKSPVTDTPITSDLEAVERELEAFLENGAGVGRVKVMLTLECSSQTIYMTEESVRISEGGSDESREVSKASSSGDDVPLIKKTLYPRYRGACILCEGAHRDEVRLWITQTVSSLLGLGSDKIVVETIKQN